MIREDHSSPGFTTAVPVETRIEELLARIRSKALGAMVSVSDEEVALLRQRVPKKRMRHIDREHPELWAKLAPIIVSIYEELIAGFGDEGAYHVLLFSPYRDDGFVIQIAVKHALLPDRPSTITTWVKKFLLGS